MPRITAVGFVTLLVLACAAPPARADGADPDPWIGTQLDDLLGLYKHLHAHPELSFHEVKTSERVAEELKKAGAEVTTGVGRYGVVGVIKNGVGPTVLIRSDLDALPVEEKTGLPYASKQKTTDDDGKDVSVMHACGHDVHMTCLVGTARWLATHRDRWAGTALLIGQPAEEKIGGAKLMLADGLYERFPKPDAALALHVTHNQPTGVIAYTSGPALASSTSVDVTVKGRGSHGAAPHFGVDPIVLAALIVVDLQTISSREVDPVEPCVVTVGSIHGGTKHNIIPDEVKLQLTLRAYREDVRRQLLDGIERRIKGLAEAHRAPPPEFTVRETTPPTVNTPELVARVLPALKRAVGAEHVKSVPPVMGAEDFGLFGKGGVPTFMFRLGTIPPEALERAQSHNAHLPDLHSGQYAPEPKGSIATGVKAMTAAAAELMPPNDASRQELKR
jgi:hippurate hydrolase